MTGIYHHVQLFLLRWGLANVFCPSHVAKMTGTNHHVLAVLRLSSLQILIVNGIFSGRKAPL
jgi:hypothetical protein